jgi:hypothetical protein
VRFVVIHAVKVGQRVHRQARLVVSDVPEKTDASAVMTALESAGKARYRIVPTAASGAMRTCSTVTGVPSSPDHSGWRQVTDADLAGTHTHSPRLLV